MGMCIGGGGGGKRERGGGGGVKGVKQWHCWKRAMCSVEKLINKYLKKVAKHSCTIH